MKGDPAAIARGVLCAAFVVFFIIAGGAYLGNRAMPFGYYLDLGVNIFATGTIDANVTSLRDALDAVGWAPWDNAPAFAFNPMLTYVVSVPLAKLLGHDAAGAVKLVQVAQFAVAWAGGAVLYAVVRGQRSTWAVLAGVAYAIAPNTGIAIRGNNDFGFTVALLPWALAGAIVAIDRRGPRALPLAGALCGVASICFAVEYLFFTSLPLYAICAARAVRGRPTLAWFVWTVGGLVCLGAVGAFVLLPSAASTSMFRTPASQLSDIEAGALTRLFSETVVLLFTLVPKEAAISPLPGFNVTSSLPVIAAGAALLWAGTIVTVASRARIRRYRLGIPLAVCGLCVVLSLGTNVPLGDALWRIIGRTPLLQLMRTPDRFIGLPALFFALLAVAGFEVIDRRLRSARRNWLRLTTLGLLASALGLSLAFDSREHVLETEPTIASREPAYADANAAARSIGGRTVSLAFVRSDSILGTSLYGMGLPFQRYGWDLVERFGLDSLAGTALLARSGVSSIIVTPNWTTDGPDLPNFKAVLLGVPSVHRVFSRAGVSVFALPAPSSAIEARRPSCLRGTIGLLDRALGVPELSTRALVATSEPCGDGVLLNYDPLDGVIPRSASWAAAALAPGRALRDADYPYNLSRNLIAERAYRDAVDGSSPFFDRPPVKIEDRWAALLPSSPRPRSKADLLLRLANHRPVAGVVVAGKRQIPFAFAPEFGLHWRTIDIGAIPAGARLAVALRPFGPDAYPDAPWHGVALDAVALAPRALRFTAPAFSTPQVVVAVARDGAASRVWIPRGRYAVAAYFPSGKIVPAGLAIDGRAVAGEVGFAASGWHRSNADRMPLDSILVFDPLERPVRRSPPSVTRLSSASWAITVRERQTIEAAVLDDGNWQLAGSNVRVVQCDLVNTCFYDVPAGSYRLIHRWPPSIIGGFGLAIASIVVALSATFARSRYQLVGSSG